MGTKVFLERTDGVKLVGDERDIMLPSSMLVEVFDWCDEVGIAANLVNTNGLAANCFGVLLWRVTDDRERLVFNLRWAK